ncbi:MAG: hypothetical protein PHP92_05220 [Candidatus Nanoarchaeia archaeon]|nr:hypothetical protein [Candidatus Nanoarchaeia archaeon]
MKNLNQLLKIPILQYDTNDKKQFEKYQARKLVIELAEFEIEKDELKKACEALDVLQVSFSLLNLFDHDTIDQAWRLNLEKHKDRKIFDIVGKYEIFKILHKK